MVRVQGQSRLMGTPQRRGDNLVVPPTPIIGPGRVGGVLTGLPRGSGRYNVAAPAMPADTPSSGVTFVMRVPIVFAIFQTPLIVPNAIAVKLASGRHIYMLTNSSNDICTPSVFS